MDTAVGGASRGAISEHETYPLKLFMQLTGLSDWALRNARRDGLKMTLVGRSKFVCGADWKEFLQQKQERGAAAV